MNGLEAARPRRGSRERKPTSTTARRVTVVVAATTVLLAAAVVWSFETVPAGNAGDGPVDAIVVLGVPARPDGRPSKWQRWRVNEAVLRYRAGVAPRILFSGGAAANRWPEAAVMAEYARGLGVPGDAILEETSSKTTWENVEDSQRLLDAHGWRRVEVVSAATHLHRAALFLAASHLEWRVHASPTPGQSRLVTALTYVEEACVTALLRWFGFRVEPLVHTIAGLQQRITAALTRDAHNAR